LSPVFQIGGLAIDSFFLAIFYLFVFHFDLSFFRSKYIILFSYLLFCTSYWFLLHIIFFPKNLDINLFILFLKIPILTIAGYFLASNLNTNEFRYLKLIIYVISVNSIIVLFEFFFPNIKSIFENILFQDSQNINYSSHLFRLRGLSKGGGASLSFLYAFATLALVYLSRHRIIAPLEFMVLLLLNMFACFFIGRTGLYSSLAIILLYIVISINIRLSVIIILLSIFISDKLIYLLGDDYLYNYIFGTLEGFLTDGSLENDSLAQLKTFYHISGDILILLFGNGYYFIENYNHHTDSGILKLFYGQGLIMFFLFYTFLSYLVIKLSARTSGFLFLAYLLIFIFEFKEPVLFQNYLSRVFFILVGVLSFNLANFENRSRNNIV
jgi:hypothetical protein